MNIPDIGLQHTLPIANTNTFVLTTSLTGRLFKMKKSLFSSQTVEIFPKYIELLSKCSIVIKKSRFF